MSGLSPALHRTLLMRLGCTASYFPYHFTFTLLVHQSQSDMAKAHPAVEWKIRPHTHTCAHTHPHTHDTCAYPHTECYYAHARWQKEQLCWSLWATTAIFVSCRGKETLCCQVLIKVPVISCYRSAFSFMIQHLNQPTNHCTLKHNTK